MTSQAECCLTIVDITPIHPYTHTLIQTYDLRPSEGMLIGIRLRTSVEKLDSAGDSPAGCGQRMASARPLHRPGGFESPVCVTGRAPSHPIPCLAPLLLAHSCSLISFSAFPLSPSLPLSLPPPQVHHNPSNLLAFLQINRPPDFPY